MKTIAIWQNISWKPISGKHSTQRPPITLQPVLNTVKQNPSNHSKHCCTHNSACTFSGFASKCSSGTAGEPEAYRQQLSRRWEFHMMSIVDGISLLH